ncbi:MAG: hypothetical protein ACRDBO_02630 [Lachnospiraceae bacterium]
MGMKNLEKADKLARLASLGFNNDQSEYAIHMADTAIVTGEYKAILDPATKSQKDFFASLSSGTKTMIGLSAALTVFSLGFSIYENYKKKQEEQAQVTRDLANAANEESQNLSQLLNSYNSLSAAVANNQASKADLVSTQNQLLSALGIEESQIGSLIEEYGDLNTAINSVSLESLKENEHDLRAGVNTAKNDLLQVGKTGAFDSGIYVGISTGQIVKKIESLNVDGIELKRQEITDDYGTSADFQSISLTTTYDTNTVDGIISKYEALKKLRQKLSDEYKLEGQSAYDGYANSNFLKQLTQEINGLETACNNYQSSIKNLNANQAKSIILTELQGSELPKTKAEFEALRESLIDAAKDDSGSFIGSQEDIKNAIINSLAAMPEFRQYYDDLRNTTEAFDLSNLAKYSQQFSEYYQSMEKAAERFSGVSLLEAAKGYGNSDQQYSDEYQKLEAFVKENNINSKASIDFWNQCLNESKSAEEAMKRYTDQKKLNLAFSDEAANSINTFAHAVNISAAAMEEQAASGYITSESWNALKESLPGVESALEHTASGLTLNIDKLRELNSEQANTNAQKLADDYHTLSKYYTQESARLSGYQSLLETNNHLTQEQRTNLEQLVNSQQATLDVTAGQMLNLEFLGSELDSVTSKYNVFKAAMNSTDSGVNFEYMASMKNQIDEMHEKGQYGKDQYRAFVDLFSAEDMSNASNSEILKAYDSSYQKYNDFIVSENAQKNLLNALSESGYATISESEDGTLVQLHDIEAAADAIGVKVDIVKMALDSLKDYGATIEIESSFDGVDEPEQALEKLYQKLEAYQQERDSLAFGFSPELDTMIQEIQAEIAELEILLNPGVDTATATAQILAIQAEIDNLDPNTGMASIARIDELIMEQQALANEYNLDLNSILKTDNTQTTQALEESTQQVTDFDELISQPRTIFLDVDDNGALDTYKTQLSDFTTKKYTVNIGLSGLSDFSDSTDKGSTGYTLPVLGKGSQWQGSAHAQGSWNVGHSGRSLVGELGRELVVRGSRYFTVGDNGAEFVPLKSNDIIFNHRQTDALLNYGKINSRGKAYASGSADDLSIDWFEHSIKLESDRSSSLKKNASSSAISYLGLTAAELEKAKSIIESADGILEADMRQLQEMAKAAGISLSELFQIIENGGYNESRRSYLAQIIESDKRQLVNYEAAIEQYQADYESVVSELTPEIRKKIEEGSLSVDTLSEDEKEKAEKAIDAFNKVQNHKSDKRDLELEQLEHIKEFYDNEIDYLDQQAERIQNSSSLIKAQIDYLKESGQIVTAASYQQLIENNKREVAIIEKKIALKKAELAELMSRDDFDENSQDYLTLENDLANLELASQQLLLADEQLKNDLLNLPIENIDTILSMYDSVIDAIKRWGAQMEASGRKVDRNYYQMLINNGMEIIDQYREQADLVREVMSEYEVGSDNWNTLYTKLQNINSAMSSMVENLYKWNEALLQIPMDTVNEFSDKLQKAVSAMTSVQSDYNTVISAVTGALQEQIDLLNEERDAHKDNYDTQIDVLQERLELLQKQNEALRVQSAYEQALYDLQNANTQKTERIIRDGEIVYETNADNIRNAEESLQDALSNLTQYELEKEIEGLQDELEAINDRYDEQIESLETISEKWSEITDKINTAKDEALASEILGSGWKDAVLSGNDEALFSMFSGMYQTLSDQIDQYEEQISSTENIHALLEDYITAYKEGTITYEQAAQGINELLSQLNQQMSSMDNLDNVLEYLAQTTGSEANAESVLSSIQDALHKTGEELIASLEQYNKNADLISGYTTSWEQLTEDVSDIKDILEDVRDNLEDALDQIVDIVNDRNRDDDDDDDDDPDVSYDYSSGKSPVITVGTSPSESGPGVPEYASGIENGLVGSAHDSRREQLLRLFSSQKIADRAHAVPIIAHEGEAVLNREQQSALLDNLASAWNYTPSYDVPSYTALSADTGRPAASAFTFGDIRIERCDNPDQLAEGILKGGLTSAIRQQLGRYN